MTAYTTQV